MKMECSKTQKYQNSLLRQRLVGGDHPKVPSFSILERPHWLRHTYTQPCGPEGFAISFHFRTSFQTCQFQTCVSARSLTCSRSHQNHRMEILAFYLIFVFYGFLYLEAVVLIIYLGT